MNILHNLRNLIFPHRPAKRKALTLYLEAVEQSRHRENFEAFELPDTQEGRFGFLSLHVYILLEALNKRPLNNKISQELVDLFFDDMDASLREMGVGDLGVGKRMKLMAKTFYGGLQAFENAKDQQLVDMIPYFTNNLYIGTQKEKPTLNALHTYIQEQRKKINLRVDEHTDCR